MKKIIIFIIIIFMILPFCNAIVYLDYRTATTGKSANMSVGSGYAVNNINDGFWTTDPGDFYYSGVGGASEGGYLSLLLNQTYIINRVLIKTLQDGSGLSNPFNFSILINGTNVYDGYFDGSTIIISINDSITATEGSFIQLVFYSFTSGKLVYLGEFGVYGYFTDSNFTINGNLSTFTANISGVFYNTNNGTIITNITNGIYNISLNASGYNTINYNNYNVGTNIYANFTKIYTTSSSTTNFYIDSDIIYYIMIFIFLPLLFVIWFFEKRLLGIIMSCIIWIFINIFQHSIVEINFIMNIVLAVFTIVNVFQFREKYKQVRNND